MKNEVMWARDWRGAWCWGAKGLGGGMMGCLVFMLVFPDWWINAMCGRCEEGPPFWTGLTKDGRQRHERTVPDGEDARQGKRHTCLKGVAEAWRVRGWMASWSFTLARGRSTSTRHPNVIARRQPHILLEAIFFSREQKASLLTVRAPPSLIWKTFGRVSKLPLYMSLRFCSYWTVQCK